MTDEDLLAVCIADEAAGEPYEGKVAVGRVVLNRQASGYQSDGTLAGTILRKFQFSGFWFAMAAGRYGQIAFDEPGAWARADKLLAEFRTQSIWADCRRAAADARANLFEGGPQFQRLTAHTVLYFNPAICAAPAWASPDKHDCTIFRHSFFHA